MDKFNIENTSGVIIGETTHTARLISPNGNEQTRANLSLDESAEKWGFKMLVQIRETILGDGSTLSERPDIERAIYGKGQWIVKI